jgi:PKD repeat protein
MKHLFSLVIIFCLVNSSSNAQEYVRLMNDQNANFYDIQNSFNNHWQGKSYEKGKGWKQFKRWEWFMEPRVFPTGKLPNPALAYNEFKKFEDTYAVKKGKTNNKTANWIPLGPNNLNSIGWNPGIGRVNVVVVDPNNSNTIYVGAPAGGCWKTTNAGNTWTPLTDHLSSLGVSGIAIDPTNSNIVYIATGDGDGSDTYSIGVLKSTDGGATWNTTGLNWTTSQSRSMRKIIIDPNNPNILFVATTHGLFRTVDAGANWQSVLSGSIRDVELNPANSNTVYACTNNLFFKSTTGGNITTFTAITNGMPVAGDVGRLAIGVTPNDTNYIYVLASDDVDAGFYGLYRSTDGGNTFSLRTNTPNVFGYNTSGSDSGGQSWYDMALAVSPSNKNEVYTGGVNVWKSTNGGATLTALSQWNWPTGSFEYVHADIHTLDFFGSTLFCGSDGGIFRSTNNGGTFTDITNGIQHSQFYRLGNSVTDAGIIMVGAQDNGCSLLKNGTWTHVTGGDGMECVVDYSNPNIMYSTSQYGNVYKSTNGGASFNGITGSIGFSGAWVSPYTLDPVDPNTIYLGYKDVWKSTDGGANWNTISSFSGASSLKSLVVAPSDNNVIYAATDNTLYRTTNGGGLWLNINGGNFPNNAITYISVHNLDPDILWVSFSGFNGGEKVYKTIDGGANWVNVSGNLPNLPINCVVYEYGTNNGIYVATDMGIYYKNDDLIQWQSYMTNLPNVIVNELEIHYGSGKIRAATFGRGLWESDLFVPSPPIAQFFSPDTNICPNNCAKFTNTTANLGTQWQWYFPGGTPSTSTDLNPIICYPSTGSYPVSLVVTNPLGTDSAYVNNYITVQIPSTGIPLPLSEGFESSTSIPNNWSVINNDEGITWEHINTVGGFGASTSCVVLDNYSTNFRGERDYLVTPLLDFSAITNARMTFDVAHAQWWSNKSDTLAIYYSTDCGVTKSLLWEKDGDILATANDMPIYFTPTATQWRNDTVSLIALAGLNSVEILIENKSDNGNLIYIDNINIQEVFGIGIEENATNTISIYPNPFKNTITIGSENDLVQSITIFNAIGKLVYAETVNAKFNKKTISLNHFSGGLYFIKVVTDKEIISKSLIKN